MEIVIEKNKVPATSPRWVEVLGNLMVNESFLVDVNKRNNVATIASQWFHKKDGCTKRFKSTMKGQPDGKVRFWRVR